MSTGSRRRRERRDQLFFADDTRRSRVRFVGRELGYFGLKETEGGHLLALPVLAAEYHVHVRTLGLKTTAAAGAARCAVVENP